ncbi:unnamed protein product [Linum tenue]|uniref:CCHC-type domain-containing protein n=1 Tax=Linum tenue TaxID=586396 RepID=A0AAV0HKT2_9ROSI|nr:unnamed protein product [Linum tenue]
MVKFSNTQDFTTAITGGPWIIHDHYLVVHEWTPSFRVDEQLPPTVVAWVRFPGFPVQYYHSHLLKTIGNSLGRTIRIDYNTEAAQRGKFARIAVELDVSKPLALKFLLNGKWQKILYENIPLICFSCGKIGHEKSRCVDSQIFQSPAATMIPLTAATPPEELTGYGPWMQVNRRSSRRPNASHQQKAAARSPASNSTGNTSPPPEKPTARSDTTTPPTASLKDPHATQLKTVAVSDAPSRHHKSLPSSASIDAQIQNREGAARRINDVHEGGFNSQAINNYQPTSSGRSMGGSSDDKKSKQNLPLAHRIEDGMVMAGTLRTELDKKKNNIFLKEKHPSVTEGRAPAPISDGLLGKAPLNPVGLSTISGPNAPSTSKEEFGPSHTSSSTNSSVQTIVPPPVRTITGPNGTTIHIIEVQPLEARTSNKGSPSITERMKKVRSSNQHQKQGISLKNNDNKKPILGLVTKKKKHTKGMEQSIPITLQDLEVLNANFINKHTMNHALSEEGVESSIAINPDPTNA